MTPHTDVPVTLLRAMGCRNAPSDFSMGKDLFDNADRGTVVLSSYTTWAILIGNLVLDVRQNGAVLSYDLDEKSVSGNCTQKNLAEALEMMKRYAR